MIPFIENIYNVSVFISIVTIALFLFRRPRSITVTCEWNGQRLWKLRLLSSVWNTDLCWNQEEGYILPQQINLGRIGIDSAAQVQVKTLLTCLISYVYICIFFIPLLTIKQKWSFIDYFDRPLCRCFRTIRKPKFETVPRHTYWKPREPNKMLNMGGTELSYLERKARWLLIEEEEQDKSPRAAFFLCSVHLKSMETHPPRHPRVLQDGLTFNNSVSKAAFSVIFSDPVCTNNT